MLRSSFLAGVGTAVLAAPYAAGTGSDLARYLAPHVAMGEFNGVVGLLVACVVAAQNWSTVTCSG